MSYDEIKIGMKSPKEEQILAITEIFKRKVEIEHIELINSISHRTISKDPYKFLSEIFLVNNFPTRLKLRIF